ncbi:hypothetical protein GGTG_12378 [Gaeumannomyces tritici R3-111a-1]|uniref:Uncharacterized protein n=1 Tax=Gaeumannomyces tritici (strain R3-111a-1) TaxID=644352 RepID=J3PFV3_GAET3|nr:hypothetical protein GGTG_12378 [Gaeumannomyces tritici R3-111a-1]EJT70205.1 hypothetical protein GGTG_12378 [Gaeumannomyces tritici R3-111a-1]
MFKAGDLVMATVNEGDITGDHFIKDKHEIRGKIAVDEAPDSGVEEGYVQMTISQMRPIPPAGHGGYDWASAKGLITVRRSCVTRW